MTPLETLQHIAERLANTDSLDIVTELMPQTRGDAMRWGRRLYHWDEFYSSQSDQAVAIARVISRRSMREFGLTFSSDGHVVDQEYRGEKEESMFELPVGGQTLLVTFTCDDSTPCTSTGFSFEGKNNPLSETGFWHCFVPDDAVGAVGGAYTFATKLAEAKLAGREKEFLEQFDGVRREEKPKRRAAKTQSVVGEHTAKVVEERVEQAESEPVEPTKPVSRAMQGGLFE